MDHSVKSNVPHVLGKPIAGGILANTAPTFVACGARDELQAVFGELGLVLGLNDRLRSGQLHRNLFRWQATHVGRCRSHLLRRCRQVRQPLVERVNLDLGRLGNGAPWAVAGGLSDACIVFSGAVQIVRFGEIMEIAFDLINAYGRYFADQGIH